MSSRLDVPMFSDELFIIEPLHRPRSHPARDEVRERAREGGHWGRSRLKLATDEETHRAMKNTTRWTFGTIESVNAPGTEREPLRTPDYAALRDKIMESAYRQMEEMARAMDRAMTGNITDWRFNSTESESAKSAPVAPPRLPVHLDPFHARRAAMILECGALEVGSVIVDVGRDVDEAWAVGATVDGLDEWSATLYKDSKDRRLYGRSRVETWRWRTPRRAPDYAALRDKSSIMESLARQLDERLESYQVDAKARAQKPDPYTEHRLREADLMQVAAAPVDAADETAPFVHFNDPAWLAARERAFAARRAEVAAYRQAAQIADPYEAHRIVETATLERRTVEGETGFFVDYWDWHTKDPGTWTWDPPRTSPKTTRRG